MIPEARFLSVEILHANPTFKYYSDTVHD